MGWVGLRKLDPWPCLCGALTDNYKLQIITKRSIFAGEMYPTICVEWAGGHFGLGLM